MLGPLPELKPMARARMGYRCHGWRHLGRSTKRWRSAGIGSCRRTPLGGTRGSSALHAPDGRPEGSDGRHIDRKNFLRRLIICERRLNTRARALPISLN